MSTTVSGKPWTTTSATSASSLASSTSSSTSSTSAAATLSSAFSFTSGYSSSWLSSTALKFRSNLSNGYQLEAQGSSTGYAATVGTALNDNGLQQVFFNSIGIPEDYVSCTQHAAGTPHLDCKVNDVLQQAIVCDDNWNNLYLVAVGDSYPE
ncbi:hypothetical protein KCV07_g5878, partial [Aureobasidium melanogenum]